MAGEASASGGGAPREIKKRLRPCRPASAPARGGQGISERGWGPARNKEMKIAYQGEPGAFSEAAALQINPDAQLIPSRAFEDVFDTVKGGPAGYGVLPIENSIGGSIHRNFDLLLEHELPIVAEVELPVVHHLLAFPATTMEKVKRIYSHPQALAQCDRFLRTLTGVEIIATYDTAGSAKLVADQHMDDGAAIASARAAQVFGLAQLRSSIQDYEHNVTRFLVIGRRPLSDAKADKTSALPSASGASAGAPARVRTLSPPVRAARRRARCSRPSGFPTRTSPSRSSGSPIPGSKSVPAITTCGRSPPT